MRFALWSMPLVLLGWCVVSSGPALGQSRVTGVVVDARSGDPLPGANVFLDQATDGTTTRENGRFRLTNLPPGTHTIVASMIGYGTQRATVTLKPPSKTASAPPPVRFELPLKPVQMAGVTVEGSRDEWLERLERFRQAFFGTVPNADQCSFVNPEVLSFEENGASLIARTNRPLRVRNEALGYELTYHLSRYVVSPDRRMRLGPVEFDTLAAQSPEQRRAWMEARRKTYTGSYAHFIDALRSDALGEEGFRVGVASPNRYERGTLYRQSSRRGPLGEEVTVADASEIYRSVNASGLAVLSMPDNNSRSHYLEVRYVRAKEHPQFYETYRSGRPRLSYQRSWIRFVQGTKALIDTHTGSFVHRPEMGYIMKEGHWGWYETAATALPERYHPPSTGQ